MSESFLENPFGLLGLVGGALIALIVFYLARKNGKKKHMFDERYQKVNNRAKAKSYDATLLILLIAWGVVIVFEGISFSFFLVMAIYILHCLMLIITTAFYSNKED